MADLVSELKTALASHSVSVACPNCRVHVSAPAAQGWPTPQPIETAPLGQLMAWPADADEEGGPTWSHEWPQEGETLETWREALKQFGATHWLPMPPPPGGGK